MTGSTSSSSATSLDISDEIRKEFPEIVEMIIGSESMNDEERQYWINILPIMTPEQLQNLRDILTNEIKQLADIDKKYAKDLSPEEQQVQLKTTEADIAKKRAERSQREEDFEKKDDAASDDLLKEIESL